jgi:hypothetical protein
MAYEKCKTCKIEFFKNSGDTKCPNCDGLIEPRASVEPPRELKSSLVEQAENQARVVGKFGEILQVIGYVLIAIFSVGFVVSLFMDNWIQVIICLIAIPATFISYNVFGSALRAVALYIQVKVK